MSTATRSPEGEPERRRRGLPIWLALTVAPPVVALPVALAFVFAQARIVRFEPSIFIFAMFWIFFTLISLLAAWSLGLAWHFRALRRKQLRVGGYAKAGAAIGVLLGPCIALLASALNRRPDYDAIFPFVTIGWFGIWGALMGTATAWFAWFMRRPDRDIVPSIASEFE